ncbi:MAG: hypothetical protein FJ025_05725 [Chloroflexi bacterium]|nr:hypothetical protein [Chloroflexota bacterium]
MQHNPQPGQVLFYKDFQFENGSKGDKLFVILHVAGINAPCLVLKTTSQSKRYAGAKEGCDPQKKVFFIPKNWRECFPLNTYIQLPQIIEIESAEIFAGTLSKRMRLMNAISADCLTKLKNCLKRFKGDISLQHWNLIFQS